MDSFVNRVAVARRFGSRVAAGNAVFLAKAGSRGRTPCTQRGEFSGLNRLMLMQVMKDRGWSDSRFFTASQVRENGWSLMPWAKAIRLQFLVSTELDGAATERPGVKTFHVFNGCEIGGVGMENARFGVGTEDVQVATARAGFQNLDQWLMSLQKPSKGAQAVRASWVELMKCVAVAFVGSAVGVDLGEKDGTGFVHEWERDIETDPLFFCEVVNEAQAVAASVVCDIRSVAHERFIGEQLERQRVAQKSNQSTINEGDLVRRWGASAVGLKPQVRAEVLIEEFRAEMDRMGLSVKGEIKDDGRWHHVPVNTKKDGARNKSGSYILSLNGGRHGQPLGTIMNRHTGEQCTWTRRGEVLTPEARARARSEGTKRAEVAAQEALVLQEAAARHAGEILACGAAATGHGYLVKKGIAVDGLRQVGGSVLLRYDEFVGEGGRSAIRPDEKYLVVPMTNVRGELRGVQAISADGAVKSFMRGAQKKGTMFVLGAAAFAELARQDTSTAVGYAEGLATGASFRAAGNMPVVVCFDAGNLETVVEVTVPRLRTRTVAVLAVDNDQFHVERALGFLSNAVGVNPHAPGGAVVEVGSEMNVRRSVGLGDVVADGQWHQGSVGRYCMTLERETGGPEVGAVRVIAIEKDGARKEARFGNRGVQAGLAAMAAVSKLDPGRKVVMAIPEFASVAGRPTDWNDLVQTQGLAAARSVLEGIATLKGIAQASQRMEPSVDRKGFEERALVAAPGR